MKEILPGTCVVEVEYTPSRWLLAELMEKGFRVGKPWRDTFVRHTTFERGWCEYLRVEHNAKVYIFTSNDLNEYWLKEWKELDMKREVKCISVEEVLNTFYEWCQDELKTNKV